MSDSFSPSHPRPHSSQRHITDADHQRIVNLHDLGLLPKRVLADAPVNSSSTSGRVRPSTQPHSPVRRRPVTARDKHWQLLPACSFESLSSILLDPVVQTILTALVPSSRSFPNCFHVGDDPSSR